MKISKSISPKFSMLFFFIFCLVSFTAKAVEIEIVCAFGSSYFSAADPRPGNDITYDGKSKNEEWDIVASSTKWTVTGGTIVNGGNGSTFVSVEWQNTPNSSCAHKITLSADVKKGSTTNPASNTPSKCVTVLHLGAISGFSINSTSVSNNGSYTLSCGSRNVFLDFNTPTTDPSAPITYTWSYPSGWSGATSTTTTDNILYANAGGQGTIQVTAKRNDATLEQLYYVNINRPYVGPPTINTSNPIILCSGQTKTISVSANNATDYSWQPFRGVSSVGSTTNQSYSFQNSSSGSIKVTVDNACQNPQDRTYSVYSVSDWDEPMRHLQLIFLLPGKKR